MYCFRPASLSLRSQTLGFPLVNTLSPTTKSRLAGFVNLRLCVWLDLLISIYSFHHKPTIWAHYRIWRPEKKAIFSAWVAHCLLSMDLRRFSSSTYFYHQWAMWCRGSFPCTNSCAVAGDEVEAIAFLNLSTRFKEATEASSNSTPIEDE